MTDLEKFIELYKSFGIDCIVGQNPDGTKAISLKSGNGFYPVTKSDKFDGYSGFYSEVIFCADGSFSKQTFFE